MQEDSQQFRLHWSVTLVIVAFGAMTLGCLGLPTYCLVTGWRPTVTFRSAAHSHPATSGDLIDMVLGGLVGVAVTVFLWMARRNIGIWVGSGRIKATNIRGRTTFEASWSEVEFIEQGTDKNDKPVRAVCAKGRRLEVDSRYADFKSTPSAIFRYAPHLKR